MSDTDEYVNTSQPGRSHWGISSLSLLVKRTLSTMVQEDETKMQRENIFQTRCMIGGKVCMMIIDSGSGTNIVSTEVVEKLNLRTTKHPHPYDLQWLNASRQIRVTEQARITFSISKYEDEVLCDVVPMNVTHLLLGRPWEFDRRVQYDGFTNQYTFKFKGKKVTLVPLSPQQAHEDWLFFDRKRKSEAHMRKVRNNNNYDTIYFKGIKDLFEEADMEGIKELFAEATKDEAVEEKAVSLVSDISRRDHIISPRRCSQVQAEVVIATKHTDVRELMAIRKELQAYHTYHDPFSSFYNPLYFAIADLYPVKDRWSDVMFIEIFPYILYVVGRKYVGLFTHGGPRLVFDPGIQARFEDESFSNCEGMM